MPRQSDVSTGAKEAVPRKRANPKACIHGRQKYSCKVCGGGGVCVHGRRKHTCKPCGGHGICAHGRVKYQCVECGGKSICKHKCVKFRCRECRGTAICRHGNVKYTCRQCSHFHEGGTPVELPTPPKTDLPGELPASTATVVQPTGIDTMPLLVASPQPQGASLAAAGAGGAGSSASVTNPPPPRLTRLLCYRSWHRPKY